MTDIRRLTRPWRLGIAALVVVLAAHAGLWAYACHRLEAEVRRAAASSGATGWTVVLGGSRWGGWPLAASVRFAPAQVRGSATTFPADLDWAMDALRFQLDAFGPKQLLATAEGASRVSAAGLPPVALTAGLAQATIDLRARDPARVRLQSLRAAVAGSALAIETADLAFPPDAVGADLLGVSVHASDGTALPPAEELRFRLATTVPFPAAATSAEAARLWRDAGGRVALSTAALRWGPMAATGDGSGGLDATLQPHAEGTVEAIGAAPFVDMLARAGAVPGPAAAATKAVLAVLAAPNAGRSVRLPVTLDGGVVSVARYPLMRLPPLAWPDG